MGCFLCQPNSRTEIWAFCGGYPASMAPSNRGKEEFWTELNDPGNLAKGAWCVGGDFNEVLHSLDRSSFNAQLKKVQWLGVWFCSDRPSPLECSLYLVQFRRVCSLQQNRSFFYIATMAWKISRCFVKKICSFQITALYCWRRTGWMRILTPFRFENMRLRRKSFRQNVGS